MPALGEVYLSAYWEKASQAKGTHISVPLNPVFLDAQAARGLNVSRLKPDDLGWRTQVMRRDTAWGREKEA